MEYIVLGGIGILIAFALGYFLYRRSLAMKIMETGIRVKGLMIHITEKPALSKDKFAGRIYLPTVSFFTLEGQPVTGTTITGFKSFKEVFAPMEVEVIYDPKNPKRFCMEMK